VPTCTAPRRPTSDLPSADYELATDRLAEATLAIKRMDYNVSEEAELKAVLEVKATLGDLCLELRASFAARRRAVLGE
jgi:hypothetical protein